MKNQRTNNEKQSSYTYDSIPFSPTEEILTDVIQQIYRLRDHGADARKSADDLIVKLQIVRMRHFDTMRKLERLFENLLSDNGAQTLDR